MPAPSAIAATFEDGPKTDEQRPQQDHREAGPTARPRHFASQGIGGHSGPKWQHPRRQCPAVRGRREGKAFGDHIGENSTGADHQHCRAGPSHLWGHDAQLPHPWQHDNGAGQQPQHQELFYREVALHRKSGDEHKSRPNRDRSHGRDQAKRPCFQNCHHHLPLSYQSHGTVIAAKTMYRPPFANVTKATNGQKFSRSAPATTVIGSPTIGSQLASKDHLP